MWHFVSVFLGVTPIQDYHYLPNQKERPRLSANFDVPLGYERVSVETGSFGEWLRHLPLSADNQVRSHRGDKIVAPNAAVVELDLGRGNLQQCADSILRLYAEYRWSVDKGRGWAFILVQVIK